MTAYVEYELRCDGVKGDPYGCEPPIYASSETRARVEAAEAGWLVGVRGDNARAPRKDYCAVHRLTRKDRT